MPALAKRLTLVKNMPPPLRRPHKIKERDDNNNHDVTRANISESILSGNQNCYNSANAEDCTGSMDRFEHKSGNIFSSDEINGEEELVVDKNNTTEVISTKLSEISINASPKNLRNKKPWRTPIAFPQNVFFDVRVQYVPQYNPTNIWVMDASNEPSSETLLEEINKNINQDSESIERKNIKVGEVVAVLFQETFSRAEILSEINHLNKVKVRLIDYGYDFNVNVAELKEPIPLMKNSNAYAFCITFRNRSVKTGDRIQIKIIGKDEDNSTFLVEEGSCPPRTPNLESVVDQLTSECKISSVHLLDNKTFIAVRGKQILQINLMKNHLKDSTIVDLSSIGEGCFVAANTSYGWERGFILGCYKDEKFVFYCADIGHIEVVTEIKMVPQEFLDVPIQAFILKLQNEPRPDYLSIYLNSKQDLLLKPVQLKQFRYEIYDGSINLGEFVTKPWLQQYTYLKRSSWFYSFKLYDRVRMTHICNYKEVYLSLASQMNCYFTIFNDIGRKNFCTNVEVNDIVLALYQGNFVRCRVLGKTEIGASVLNLDSGVVFIAQPEDIKYCDNFVRYAPIYTMKATLNDLCNVLSDPLEDAHLLLKSYMNEEKTFILNEITPNKFVELLYEKHQHISVNKHLETIVLKSIEEINRTREPVHQVEIKDKAFIHANDVEIIPIPIGEENIQILVLDDSMIGEGVITACVYDEDIIQKQTEERLRESSIYCNDPNNKQEHMPRHMELCLAQFECDGKWYRAVCINTLEKDKFLVNFLDYGNAAVVHKSKIREISKDFLYPCLANSCFVKGLPQAMSTELLNSLGEIIYPTAILTPVKIEVAKNNFYLLHLKEIKELLP